MRNVVEFGGNTTDCLWDMMGAQSNTQGVERHGQSCFLTVHPVGTAETRAHLDGFEHELPYEMDTEPSGPIDEVAQAVLEGFVQAVNMQNDPSVFEYDGYRVGAGWIYGALLVAKAHGCTQALVAIASNDGNLSMEAWDITLGAYVTATHITYYGT